MSLAQNLAEDERGRCPLPLPSFRSHGRRYRLLNEIDVVHFNIRVEMSLSVMGSSRERGQGVTPSLCWVPPTWAWEGSGDFNGAGRPEARQPGRGRDGTLDKVADPRRWSSLPRGPRPPLEYQGGDSEGHSCLDSGEHKSYASCPR